MGVRRVRTLAWKGLLYLVVAVVLVGVTRDLMLTALLTAGFAAGDCSVAVLLRGPAGRTDRTGDEGPQHAPLTRADQRSMP